MTRNGGGCAILVPMRLQLEREWSLQNGQINECDEMFVTLVYLSILLLIRIMPSRNSFFDHRRRRHIADQLLVGPLLLRRCLQLR